MRKHLPKIFLLLIPIFLAFTFKSHVGSGWYFQSLPELNGANIADMTFTDSLTGYIVTNQDSFNTGYILKTTNGGDNWEIVFQNNIGFTKVHFLNNLVGFAASLRLMKTTNGGNNWFELSPLPSNAGVVDMSIVEENEIWATNPVAFDGGLSRSTNGGMNWTRMFYDVIRNPSKIYMYNSRLGFMVYSNKLYRTSNSGVNWDSIPGEQHVFDFEIKFTDSLIGWKNNQAELKKTINGGIDWFIQTLPNFLGAVSGVNSFSIVNKDTLWASGGYVEVSPTDYRTIIYKTTNGGTNWGYQLPSNENHYKGYKIRFSDNNHGWVYLSNGSGFHTKDGGNDTTIFVGIQQISSQVPNNFKLYQNYPNPFNPVTKINYQLTINSFVTMKVFDLNGKAVRTLLNKKLSEGTYSVEFNGANISSGIYFYTLQTENFKETKKMMLIK